MILTPDSVTLTDLQCTNIINSYKDKLEHREFYLQGKLVRKQKLFSEKDHTSEIFNSINKIIKVNLGEEYLLLRRVTILRYDEGDFFAEHSDGPGNRANNKELPYHFYGGIELSNREDFDGGEFFIKGQNVNFKKGRLFTHGYDDLHGVREVTRGTRWSIHFLIIKNYIDKLI